MVYVLPNETQISITNLEPGTNYFIHVNAIFDNPASELMSEKLVENTLGFGPDNCEYTFSLASFNYVTIYYDNWSLFLYFVIDDGLSVVTINRILVMDNCEWI